jgi:hypothetical protein
MSQPQLNRRSLFAAAAGLVATAVGVPYNRPTLSEVLAKLQLVMGRACSRPLFDGDNTRMMMGVSWTVTIKKPLAAEGETYVFADPKFIGKEYSLVDDTYYVKPSACRKPKSTRS